MLKRKINILILILLLLGLGGELFGFSDHKALGFFDHSSSDCDEYLSNESQLCLSAPVLSLPLFRGSNLCDQEFVKSIYRPPTPTSIL